MSMVNISLMTFNHFNICKFLSEIETEYPDLYYCTAVRWFGSNEAGGRLSRASGSRWSKSGAGAEGQTWWGPTHWPPAWDRWVIWEKGHQCALLEPSLPNFAQEEAKRGFCHFCCCGCPSAWHAGLLLLLVWPSTLDSAPLFLLSGPLCSPITLCCESSCQGLIRTPGLCCGAQPQAFSRSVRYKPSSSPAFPKACGPMLACRVGAGVRWVRPWAHSLRSYCPQGCTSAGWAPYLSHPPPSPGWCSVKQGSVVSGDIGISLHTICHCTLLQSLE